jgi:CheY-like chemotaxis protein
MEFAISAADALTRIAGTIEQTLVLILSDINMPGMTGLEMLPKVREMRPNVPITMITAYGDPETKRKAIESGATGLLTKPIDFTLLEQKSIRAWVKLSDRQLPSPHVDVRNWQIMLQKSKIERRRKSRKI